MTTDPRITLEPSLQRSQLDILMPGIVLAIEYDTGITSLGAFPSSFTETRAEFNSTNALVLEFISLTNRTISSARTNLSGSYPELRSEIKVKDTGKIEIEVTTNSILTFEAIWDPNTYEVEVEPRIFQTMSWRMFILLNKEITTFQTIINENAT